MGPEIKGQSVIRWKILSLLAHARSGGRVNAAATAKHFAGQTAFSALAFVWSIAIARLLGVDGKGAVSAILLCAALVGSLGIYGTREGLSYYVGRLGVGSARRLFGLCIGQALIVALIGALFASIAQALGAFALRDQSTFIVAAAGSSAGALVLSGQLQVILIAAGEITAAAIGPVIQILTALILLASCAATIKPSVDFAVAAYIASILISVGFYVWRIRLLPQGGRPTVLSTKEYWQYCTRAVPSSVAQFLNYRFDQAVIAASVGATGLGVYGAAVNVAEVAVYPAASIAAIVLPIAARTAERRSLTARTLVSGIVVGLASVVALWVVGPGLVAKLFGPGFAEASKLIPILLVASLAGGMARIASSLSAGFGRPEVGSVASLGALAVTLSGCVWAIPRYGILGAAWVSLAAYAVSAGIASIGLVLTQQPQAERMRSTRRLALVTHVYTDDNAGDAGITEGVSEILKDAGYQDLQGWSTYSEASPTLAARLPYNAHRFQSIHRAVWGGYQDLLSGPGRFRAVTARFMFSLQMIRAAACFLIPRLCLWPIWFGSERTTIEAIHSADIVVSKGGGFLYCERVRELPFLMRMCLPILIAGKFGKRVVLLGQTIGPLRGGLSRWIVKRTLSHSHAIILARETTTEKLLAELDVPRARVLGIPDCAFKLRQPFDPTGSSGIALSVRPWQFHSSLEPKAAYHSYLRAMASVASILTERGFDVSLVAQVTSSSEVEDDRVACRAVAQQMTHEASIVAGPFSPRDWVRFYGKQTLVIATRAHAAIYSMCAGTPLIHISYNPKGIGIMGDNGMGHLCMPIEDVSEARLIQLVDRVLSSMHEVREQVRMRGRVNEQRLAAATSFLRGDASDPVEGEDLTVERLALRA